MHDKIQKAFEHIKAEERLTQNTYAQIAAKIQKKKRITLRRYVFSFASLLILIGIGWTLHSSYTTQTTVLDIDVNPSIEFSLNRFDRVIGTYAYNDEGKMLLESIDTENKSYQEALGAVVNRLSELGYMPRESLFTATVVVNSSDADNSKYSEIKKYINELISSKSPDIRQDIFSVDDIIKSHAHNENVSPAKYLAILELQNKDPSVSFETCHNESIDEIKNHVHRHGNTNQEKKPGNHHRGMQSGTSGCGCSKDDSVQQSDSERQGCGCNSAN